MEFQLMEKTSVLNAGFKKQARKLPEHTSGNEVGLSR